MLDEAIASASDVAVLGFILCDVGQELLSGGLDALQPATIDRIESVLEKAHEATTRGLGAIALHRGRPSTPQPDRS